MIDNDKMLHCGFCECEECHEKWKNRYLRQLNTTMMEWIKCTDRMPDLDTEVLCWVECSSCRSGENHCHKCLERGYPSHGAYIDMLMDVDGKIRWSKFKPNITHWMPLPECPK